MVSVLPVSIAQRTKKEVLLVGGITLLPLVFILAKDFMLSRRGFRIQEIQFEATFWALRFLAAPLVVYYTVRLWQEVTRPLQLILVHLAGFLLYSLFIVGISFAITRFYLAEFDGRNWNLFQTIRQLANPNNLFVYVVTVCLIYARVYFVRFKEAGEKARPTDQTARYLQQVVIKKGSKQLIIPINEVLYFEADGPYVKVVTEKQSHLLSRPLKQLERDLPESFARIHRSSILRLDQIASIRNLPGGDALVTLRNGAELRLSRTYRENLPASVRNA